MERELKEGRVYRHFKNKLYLVLGIVNHSETQEKLVLYKALYGDCGLYVRPLEMFLEKVPKEKENPTGQIYRFELIEE